LEEYKTALSNFSTNSLEMNLLSGLDDRYSGKTALSFSASFFLFQKAPPPLIPKALF
jgi:hypothetical protein